MEDFTPQRKRELLLFHNHRQKLLQAGLITSLAATLCVGLITFPLMPRVPIGYRSSALFLVFLSTLFIGPLLRQEIVLSRKYRYPAGIPLYYTIVSLTSFAFGFLMVVGDSSLTQSPLFQFLVVPFLLVFLGGMLYGLLTKILFCKILERFSNPDYVSLHFRDQIWEYLNPLWEATQKNKDPCTVALLRIQVAPAVESITEALQRLQTAEGILKSQVRLTDRCGAHSRDTLFVIFPNTTAEVSEIPLNRIKKALQGGGFAVTRTTSADIRNAAGSSADLLATLEANV